MGASVEIADALDQSLECDTFFRGELRIPGIEDQYHPPLIRSIPCLVQESIIEGHATSFFPRVFDSTDHQLAIALGNHQG